MGAGASTLPDDIPAAIQSASEADLKAASEDAELMGKLTDDDREKVLGALKPKTESTTVFKVQSKNGFIELQGIEALSAYFASLSAAAA